MYSHSLLSGVDMRKTTQEYWDEKYTKKKALTLPNFQEHELVEIIMPFISDTYIRMIEIGCAPANILVRISKKYPIITHGIDYSPAGVELSRCNFRDNNIDPSDIIESDFFDKEFLKDNKNKYDIVCSFGFIEHFDDTKDVIKKHLHLLKEGGLLIITIPNFRHINATLLGKKILSTHNTSIMSPEELEKQIPKGVKIILTKYHGGAFNFGLFHYDNKLLEIGRKLITGIQRLTIDPLHMLMFRLGVTLENKYFSPSIILIGVKE